MGVRMTAGCVGQAPGKAPWAQGRRHGRRHLAFSLPPSGHPGRLRVQRPGAGSGRAWAESGLALTSPLCCSSPQAGRREKALCKENTTVRTVPGAVMTI